METTPTLETHVNDDIELDIDLDIRTTTWDTAQNVEPHFYTIRTCGHPCSNDCSNSCSDCCSYHHTFCC